MKKEIYVLSLSRSEVELSIVDSKNKKVLDKHKTKWNPDSPEESAKILEFLKSSKKSSKIRILLRKDAYYLLELPYKAGLTRRDIHKKVSGIIPEELDEKSWDYKVVEEKIVAFAPVKSIYEAILKPLKETQKEVEAVEPEEISIQQNEDPVIGIALKTDLKGKDTEVLNLEEKKEPRKAANKKDKQNKTEEEIKKQDLKKNIILIVVIMLLFGGAIFMLVSYSNKVKARKANNIQKTLEEIEKKDKRTQPTTQRMEEMKILITGIELEKDHAKEILEAEGFEKIAVGKNLDEEPEKTLLQRKKDVLQETIDLIEQALNSEYDLEISEEPLEEENENSVVLTVGQRISTTN